MVDQVEMMKHPQVLADFADFAIRSDRLDDVLTEACRLVAGAFGTGRARVLEIQEGRQELLVRASFGAARDGAGASVVPLANVPIFVSGQRPYGALELDDTGPREFNDDEIGFLRTCATMLGAAIDRLQLIEERAQARMALRESEERQAFQLQLSDSLATLTDPEDIQAEATRLLAKQLDAGWCYFNEFDERGTHAVVLRDFHRDELPSMVGVHDLSAERGFLELVHSGNAFSFSDWASFEHFSAPAAAAYQDRGVSSALGVPLMRNGRLAAVLVAADSRPRHWSQADIELLRGAAERTWVALQRARTESARRESEQRQTFLLELSDALRAEPDADAVVRRVVEMLAAELQLDRCYAAARYPDEGRAEVVGEFRRSDLPPLPSPLRFSDYPETARQSMNHTLVFDDTATQPGLSDLDRSSLAALEFRALLSAFSHRGEGHPIGSLSAVCSRPRHWRPSEVALLEEATERVWAAIERARAEDKLRESEVRYQALFAASPVPFIVVAPNAPDFTILEVNDIYVAATQTTREMLVGRRLLDVFIHDPDHPGLRGSGLVARSIERILTTRQTDVMERLRYDIMTPEGKLEPQWWLAVNAPMFDADGNIVAVIHQATLVTEQYYAEQAARESEERQAFLLRLSDAVRPLASPADIQGETTRLLRERLNAAWCYFVDWNLDRNIGLVLRDSAREGLPSLAGAHPVSDAPEFLQILARGAVRTVRDYGSYEELPAHTRQKFVAVGFRSMMVAPLVKEGRLFAALVVGDTEIRDWSANEVSVLVEVAERTWAAIERGRAEAALRDSEERFGQFAEASAAGLWIRNAATLDMEFISPSVTVVFGAAPDALLGDVRKWAAMIVPEDRDAALEYLETARAGETAVHEFRIQRLSDSAFRWIRNTLFPLHDGARVDRVGGITEDITETRQLVDHQGVLLAELQHRVRNIMGMIRSMANRTAPGAKHIEDYRSLLEGRLLALARVQALLTRQGNAGGSLREILNQEVAAHAHHGGQLELIGTDVMLAPKTVEVLTLAFHELATNALKYGAFSVCDGHLVVSWTPFAKRGRSWLAIDWVETGAPAPAPSTRKGFGSELIEARIPYELGGTGRITIESSGARCRMEFPLEHAESILETDAPVPTTIFGGALDMTGAADLTGRTVLVVEDDYYMARDTAAALAGAGAEVLGPCASEEAAFDVLEAAKPTHAVLDLNLGGGGPRFAIAQELKRRGVPFIFLTGYDPDVIPSELADVPRLQKPAPFRTIVDTVAQLQR